MVKIDDFRNFNLYKRSIDLTKITYSAVNTSNNKLSLSEAVLIRKRAVTVARKIASGISQANILILFKQLNEAKREIYQLKKVVDELTNRGKLQTKSLMNFESCLLEIIKLLNAYFNFVATKATKHKNSKGDRIDE